MTVGEVATEYQYDNSPITIKIAGNKRYKISLKDLPGYNTPNPDNYSYTSVGGMTRQLTISYIEIKPNVYIMGVSGRLYKKSQWDNSESINGLIIRNDYHSFLFTTENSVDGSYFLRITPNISDNSAKFTNHSNLGDALLDYNGIKNTNDLIYWIENTDDPSKSEFDDNIKITYDFVKTNSFQDGTECHIGSAGEWRMVIDNLNEILDIINITDLPQFKQDWGIYTSSFFQSGNSWNWYCVDLYNHNFTLTHDCSIINSNPGKGSLYMFGKYTFKES